MKLALTSVAVALLASAAAACAAPSTDEASETTQSFDSTDPARPDLTLPQLTDYTFEVAGASTKYRVVAYGDSIFAGYDRSIFSVARRSGPVVAGEYLALAAKANVEVVRRTESGALASQIESRIENEKSYMQDASTRAVFFEMCGNDYLQARSAFSGQSGTCNLSGLDAALATCTSNMDKAMTTIAATAPNAAKAIMNLYYPGYAADDADAGCNAPSTGKKARTQDLLLPYMAHSNWRACTLAAKHGFGCADAFAEIMGSDVDTNGDGKIDSDALRFDPNESEADYVTRITVTLRGTIVDSNHKELSTGSTVGYLQGDDTHPTYYLNTMGEESTQSGPTDFSASQVVGGKNPQWNKYGHERIGHALSAFLKY